MKNIVLIPQEAALDGVISALSVVPQLVPKTKRGWFGGKAQSKHLKTIQAGTTRLDLYQTRPFGNVDVKGDIRATFTYLEIHKDRIDWPAVYAQLNGDNVTRTGQKFRVKLPSGYYVIVEPLARYHAGVSIHDRNDARVKRQKHFDREQRRLAAQDQGSAGNAKFSVGEMQRIARDIEQHREEVFTEVAEEVTDAQELAIAEQAMAEKQDTVVIDSMAQLVEQERTMDGMADEVVDLKPVPHTLAELTDQSVGIERVTLEEVQRPEGGLGTCPCDDSVFGDQQ